MGRILAVDYGLKRTGLAVTDQLRIIATPLDTVATDVLLNYLKKYVQQEGVDEFVVGLPKNLRNDDTDMTPYVHTFVQSLKQAFPGKAVHLVDERFTSVMAKRALIDGGMKKKDRQVKGNVDRVSATIILQSFLEAAG